MDDGPDPTAARRAGTLFLCLFPQGGVLAAGYVFLWAVRGEPFVVPDPADALRCTLGLATAAGWPAWLGLLTRRLWRGNLTRPAAALATLAAAALALPVAWPTLFCCLTYLGDRGLV